MRLDATKVISVVETILQSSVFWGIATLAAAAVTLSGKFSLKGADTVLIVAWVVAVVGVFRGNPVAEFSIIPRVLTTMLVVSIIGLSFYALSGWYHRKEPSGATGKAAEPQPTTTETPSSLPPASKTPHKVPPSQKGRSTPSSQPVLASPDPYVGQDDQTVARWAIREADEVQAMAAKCMDDAVQGMRNKRDGQPLTLEHWGPEFPVARFRMQFEPDHMSIVQKLHQSLTTRLGPEARGEESFQTMMIILKTEQKQSSILCMEVHAYVPNLRKMGEILLARALGNPGRH